jgi:hypothetical protein
MDHFQNGQASLAARHEIATHHNGQDPDAPLVH